MTSITLPGREFLSALAQVKYAMGKDDLTRKRLCGVHVRVGQDGALVEASDGHRSARMFLPVAAGPSEAIDLTIPRLYVGDLLRNKARVKEGQSVTLAVEGEKQIVVLGALEALEWDAGTPFPDTKGSWPTERNGWLAFETEPLRAALGLLTRDDPEKPVVAIWPPADKPRAEHLLMPLKLEWGEFV